MKLTLEILGGSREQGRAAFVVRTAKTTLLLDCGVKKCFGPGLAGAYPLLDETLIADLDAVILSHAHQDHSAALPLLYKLGYRGPVYCTAPTIPLSRTYCRSWQRTVAAHGVQPPYGDAEINAIRFIPLAYGETIPLNDLSFHLSAAGHILGSAMVHLEGEGWRLLYTADITYESRLLSPPELARETVTAAIIDGSYGTRTFSRREAETALLTAIDETVSGGGIVLLPMPRMGRSQEVMLLLAEHAHRLPPIYVEASIGEAAHMLLQHDTWLRPGAADALRRLMASPPFHFIHTPDRPQALASLIGPGPAIVMVTGGMLSGGTSPVHLHHIGGQAHHRIILTGYQAPGTPGRQLLAGTRRLRTSLGDLHVRASIRHITLKVHPSYAENLSILRQTRPRQTFVVHSEVSAAQPLARRLIAEGFTAIAPPLASRYHLHAGG